jgi:phenylacetate-CoA ligase
MRECRIWDWERECMDREALRALQGERLCQTVKRVYDNVPMYRKRMQEKGILPDDIQSVEDIRYLPFTDKPDLRDEFPYGLFAAPKHDIVRIQGSSGTTGMPIVVGYTQNDVDVWTEMAARSLTRCATDMAFSPGAWVCTRAPAGSAPWSSPCPAGTPAARSTF